MIGISDPLSPTKRLAFRTVLVLSSILLLVLNSNSSGEDYTERRLQKNFGPGTGYALDKNRSDFAMQYYQRHMSGAKADSLDMKRIPHSLATCIQDEYDIKFQDLPPFAQRAVLWDAGFVMTGNDNYSQVYTKCGLEMNSLAVQFNKYADTGASTKRCVTPNGYEYYQSAMWTEALIRNVSSCAASGFGIPVSNETLVWNNGDIDERVPDPVLVHHTMQGGDDAKHEAISIHMKEDPNTYLKCKIPSIVIPCVYYKPGNYSSTPDGWCKPRRSKFVRDWIKEEARAKNESKDKSVYYWNWVIISISSICFLAVVGGIWYCRTWRQDDLIRSVCCCCLVHVKDIEDSDVGPVTCSTEEAHTHKHSVSGATPNQTGQYRHKHRMTRSKDVLFSSFQQFHSPARSHNIVQDCHKRRKRVHRRGESFATDASSHPDDVIKCLKEDPFVEPFLVSSKDVEVYRQLSIGAYGEVWHGRLRDQEVAIKRLVEHRRNRSEDLAIFAAEIRLMATFDHPNILKLVGVTCPKLKNLYMLSELMENCDLRTFLDRQETPLTWEEYKLSIALDAARGLQYLHEHEPVVVHRDLKSKNVLIGLDLQAKLCDFGTSRMRIDGEVMTSCVGTALWTAPEVLEGKKYMEQADIYSFGVVLSELDTCDNPFSSATRDDGEGLQMFHVLHQVMHGEIRPTFSDECMAGVKELADKCLQLNPMDRPTAAQVVHYLEIEFECRSFKPDVKTDGEMEKQVHI